jgi:hypothetical protein
VFPVVYFVQQKGNPEGLIKIGKTTMVNVLDRLADLQIGSPVILQILRVLPKEKDDHPYHRMFIQARCHSEWFRPVPKLMEFIDSIPANEVDGKTSLRKEKWVWALNHMHA